MIIPYGHEHTTVRRLPWVTFTLMGLCVLVFLLTAVTDHDVSEELAREYGEFSQYLGEHPYLELTPEFEDFLFELVPEEQFRVSLEAARELGAKPPASRRLLAQQQEQLNDIMARMLAIVEEVKRSPYYVYGLVPADMRPLSLITYQFLHGGILHLFGNLLFLFLVGPFIEDVWGRPLYLAFYLSAGAVSGLMFALHYPTVDGPLIGASGAVAGVMGAFLVRYWKTRIRFFYWFGIIFTGTFTAPAWLMLPLWLARELLFAQAWDVMAPGSGGGGVAHWAHVWGFAVGMVVAAGVAYWKIEERFVDRAIESKITLVDNTGVERALEMAADGDSERAIKMLEHEVRANPENVDAAVALWNLAVQIGRPSVAAAPMLGVLRRATRTDDQELALIHWQEMIDLLPEIDVDSALAVRMAELMLRADRRPAAEESARLGQRQLTDETPTMVVMRLARVASELRMPAAVDLVGLLSRRDLAPEAEAELDRIRSELDVMEPVPQQPDEETDGAELQPLALDVREHSLQVMEAVPKQLDDRFLTIEINGTSRRMSLSQIEAVAVAGVPGENGRSMLVVDLMLDAPWSDREDLRVVRLLSTGFDPRSLVPGDDAMGAFKRLLDQLIGLSGGAPLPDPESARGRPFKAFDSLDHYQREVLGVA
jgi:membrane associated rhomboid family serine protease